MSEKNDEVDLEAAARTAADAAVSAGVDEADAWCEEAVSLTVRVYDASVENLTEAGTRGIGVRVFKDHRTGYSYGSDLSEKGLVALGRAAAEAAGVTEPDENVGLPDRSGAASVDGLASAELSSWSTERKVELALAVDRAARDRDPLISNVEDTVYSDARSRVSLVNSRGFAASFEETRCYAYAYAFAGEGTELMTG